VFNSQNTQDSIRNIWTKNRRKKYCESYRYESTKQSYFKFRVGNPKREFLSFNKKHGEFYQKLWKQKYFKTFERFSNRNINIKRISSIGNKSKVFTNNLHKKNVVGRIQSFRRLHKRSCELQKLETFEINLDNLISIEIINKEETVYDLAVVDNNNYFITEDNILVHNCGKSYALLIEPLRHIVNKQGFGAVIFRRTTPQITNEGGLWDTSVSLYTGIAKQRESSREWIFENGNKLKFSHLEYEKDAYSWQGSQIPFIGFDELTHFTKKQFFYLLSGNRSVCGVKPYVRATLNPDPDSWVADFIAWYIDQSTGFPIKERIGKLRYFLVNGGEICWGDTKKEVYEKQKHTIDTLIESNEDSVMEDYIKSFAFITGSIYENKELMKANPDYLANLLAQSEEEQLRLLYGNWKHVTNDNEMYNYTAFCDMFGSLKHCRTGKKYITADIAMQGADKYIIGVWDGNELIDIEIIDKTDGKMVIDSITRMAQLHSVSNSNIIYDNDGVGSYLGGFILNGIGFNNNRSPIAGGKKAYTNLKSQCYFISSQMVNEGKYSISENVANKRYDSKHTVKERLLYERKAIRKAKPDMDNKLSPIRKDEMKGLIGGQSPDIMDMFMMHSYFSLGISF
jgi:hypothetical protein